MSSRKPFKKKHKPLPRTKKITGPQLAKLYGWDWLNTESAARRVFELMAERCMLMRDKMAEMYTRDQVLSFAMGAIFDTSYEVSVDHYDDGTISTVDSNELETALINRGLKPKRKSQPNIPQDEQT